MKYILSICTAIFMLTIGYLVIVGLNWYTSNSWGYIFIPLLLISFVISALLAAPQLVVWIMCGFNFNKTENICYKHNKMFIFHLVTVSVISIFAINEVVRGITSPLGISSINYTFIIWIAVSFLAATMLHLITVFKLHIGNGGKKISRSV